MEQKLVQPQINKVISKSESCDASHSFSKAELQSYSDHINFYLQDDPHVKDVLPIKEDSFDLFSLVGDGIILCKLINKACPGTILEKAINVKRPLNIFQQTENLNLAINSAKAIGCVIINIHPNLIIEKREHIILGILWQIIRHQILANIDLKNHPYLIRLKEANEELQDLLKLNKEILLLRWINYHLKAAGYQKQVKNFDKDLMDGEVYVILLNQLDSNKCDKSGLNLQGLDRAKKIIADAQKLGVPKCITPTDILQGISKLNVIHLAHIFNNCPGLKPSEQELYDAAKLIDDDKDQESSREDRVYRMWMNSLNIGNVYINNLIQDMRDGLILSQIINHIQPGAIDQQKISQKVNNKMFRIQNANQIVGACKKMGLTLVGIGGTDIVDGNKKLLLAIIWQLMRHHTFSLLGKINEEDVLKWGNSRVEEQYQIKSFKDEKIKTSYYLLKLLGSVEPRAINQELVSKGEDDESIQGNAKYTISVARKLGIPVFLVWEHIKDVNSKFIFTFVACVKHFVESQKK